jgi:hypothetical protein
MPLHQPQIPPSPLSIIHGLDENEYGDISALTTVLPPALFGCSFSPSFRESPGLPNLATRTEWIINFPR